MNLFKPWYDRVLRWSRHPHAERYLGAMSFAESSFFPIPVDVMLAPMCLADRDRWIRYATIATVFSVLGGLGGYAIGWGMFEAIEPWLRESHYWGDFEVASQWLNDYGVWVVFAMGFSPLPYKVATIAAGVAVINLPGFFIGSLVGRAARFFLVAGLVRLGGDKFESTLSQYVERIGWATVVIIVIAVWFMMRG
ncbi:MAG: DedA family protein [Gammaproteobacteria bacterium]|nr:DedA family protein [Gammaproteobacteria bacterium]